MRSNARKRTDGGKRPTRRRARRRFLRLALKRNAKASRFFDVLDRVNRYAILYRVHNAKKPENRAARIAKFVAMLAAGETIHPRKRDR